VKPASQQQLNSNSNGMGLWVHQQKKQELENLPPIQQKRQPAIPQLKKSPTADLDSKVEQSLVQLLEQKY